MLLRSLLLVLFFQYFVTTSAYDKEATFKLEKEKPKTSKKVTALNKKYEWRRTTNDPRVQIYKTAEEETSKVGGKRENSLVNLDSSFRPIEGISAVARDGSSWRYFEKFAPGVAEGKQFIKNDGDVEQAEQQSSGHTKNVGTVKTEVENGATEQRIPIHEMIALTAPQQDVEKTLQGDTSAAPELKGQQSTRRDIVGLKRTISDRFRIREGVKESGVVIGGVKEAGRKAEGILVWENGNIERIREQGKTARERTDRGKTCEGMITVDYDGLDEVLSERGKMMGSVKGKVGGRVITGNLGWIKERSERSEGDKESKGMVVGGLEKMKETTEQQKLVEPSLSPLIMFPERTIVERLEKMKEKLRELKKVMSERMEGKKGEQMVGKHLNEMKGRMKKPKQVADDKEKLEQQGERVATRENMRMREREHASMTGDEDHAMMHFGYQQEGWLPNWVIRRRVERNARRNVVDIKMEEREMQGLRVG